MRIHTKAPFAPLLTYHTNIQSGTQIVSKAAITRMGDAQTLFARPSHTRCPRRLQRCTQSRPPLAAGPGGHRVACFNPEPA